MPLCLNRGSCRHPIHSRRDAPSVAVTIRWTTIAGSTWLWTYSRVELEPCHFFFNILLEWSVPLAENFLANDRKDDRGQQNVEDALPESVQFELNILHLLLSLLFNSSFFSEDRTLLLCDFLQEFFYFFFFKRKAFHQFFSFETNFERHRRFLVSFFLSDQNVLVLSCKLGTLYLFPFFMISHEDIVAMYFHAVHTSCHYSHSGWCCLLWVLICCSTEVALTCMHLSRVFFFRCGNSTFLYNICCIICCQLRKSFCGQSPGWQDINRRIPVFASLCRCSVMVICVFFVCVGKLLARRVCTECVEGWEKICEAR